MTEGYSTLSKIRTSTAHVLDFIKLYLYLSALKVITYSGEKD
jgi:hypothetical protein